jgi:nucleolar protein 15
MAGKRSLGGAGEAAAPSKRARAAAAGAPRPVSEEPESSALSAKQAALDRKKRVAGAALALGIAGDKSASFVALDDSQQEQEQEQEQEKGAAGAGAAGSAVAGSAATVGAARAAVAAARAESGPTLARRAKASKLPAVASKLGVVYLGHIPHGFFEEQMTGFFEQFGAVLRVRLSRSRRTGNSRGYAFIQFESQEVAAIVQKAMDKYILCGKLLTCELVKPENVHERMFIGAGKKPRKIDRGAMEERRHARPRSAEEKQERARRIASREQSRMDHLSKRGVVYELPGGGYTAKVKAALGADFARKPAASSGSGVDSSAEPVTSSSGRKQADKSDSSREPESNASSKATTNGSGKVKTTSKPELAAPRKAAGSNKPEPASKTSGTMQSKPDKAGARRTK